MNTYTNVSRSIFKNLIGVILIFVFLAPTISFSQPYANPSVVTLATADTYGALASTGITGSANVNGDVGTLTSSIDATISYTGTNWGVGGQHNIDAQNDLSTALSEVNGRTNDASILSVLGGQTLTRGIYGGTALDLAENTTLTLSGSATDIFIIKSSSSLVINSNSSIVLTGGAIWSNVYWYVTNSLTIFTGATFNGVVLAVGQITLNSGAALVNAKFLANTGSISIQSNVLPVELTSFSANVNNNVVSLNWDTATEVNNYGFNVERASTSLGMGWTNVGFVQGYGNSNSPRSYSFIDANAPAGKVNYRLKQIDFDGNYEYSDVVNLVIEVPASFSVKQNFPNPFNPSTVISYQLPVSSQVLIKVYDILGKELTTLVNENQVAGNHQVNFDGKNLPSGMYFYKVQAGNYSKIKKMLFIK